MIGAVVVGPLIALGTYWLSKVVSHNPNKVPLQDDPPLFTEEQIWGQPTQPAAQVPQAPPVMQNAPAPYVPPREQAPELTKAPPAPEPPKPMPMPPPDIEQPAQASSPAATPQPTAEDDLADDIAALRAIADNPTPNNLALLRETDRQQLEELLMRVPPELAARIRALLAAAVPAPVATPSAAELTRQQAEQRLLAMRDELQAILNNPSAEQLARLRDPANRAAMETALQMLAADGRWLSLVNAIRQLMTPLPSRADIEATAPVAVPASSSPAAVPAPMPAPPPDAATPTAPTAGPPPGYDPAKARKIAAELAANIEKNKYGYSKQLTRNFQTFAGIPSDGVYGGLTRSALAHFGVRRPPKALFAPTADQPYPWA